MILIRIYDYLKTHSLVLWTSLVGITTFLVVMVASMHYNENILDFLPIGSKENEVLSVYQNISGSERIVIMFDNPNDSDKTIESMDLFSSLVSKYDTEGIAESLITSFDSDEINNVMEFVLDNVPYFLDDKDYERIDSLLRDPSFIRSRLEADRQLASMPLAPMVTTSLIRDPLGLFTPVLDNLKASTPQMGFEMLDGYIFTPDMSMGIALLTSPFGGSETQGNARLVKLLEKCSREVEAEYSDVKIHMTGGPVIAVGNSSQIKKDSIFAIILSMILIAVLLFYSFNSIRNILLILLSIGWGWLFAMGFIALIKENVSIIVVGISSVILGIAVNYPLHLIAHTQHQKNIRKAIQEIYLPLLVGNITTVGAFLTLVPLKSAALKDLGIFASLLLIGTICFVLVYLPHAVKTEGNIPTKSRFIPLLASFCPEKHRSIVYGTVIISVILGIFSIKTSFNTNLADINYMTDQQRLDLSFFQNLLDDSRTSDTKELLLVSGADDIEIALNYSSLQEEKIESLVREGKILARKGIRPFLCSMQEEQHRLKNWNSFSRQFSSKYLGKFLNEAAMAGFNVNAFEKFVSLVSNTAEFKVQPIDHFKPLMSTVLAQNVIVGDKSGKCYVVEKLYVDKSSADYVSGSLENCFDVSAISNSLANNLSDNFNYIGWACSLIVFFFLWFSFGRLELAVISFLPMAVSWLWILGIMAISGIQFNIVNIILATFIFGQGDDYTIFMTEGCQFEYAHKRRVLHSYKSSIIQSALIMLIGIGTLIVAKHPAMKSLAQVTIVGMLSVVMMAYLIPPFLFNWMTTKSGKVREYPITLRSLFGGRPKSPVERVMGRYIYKGIEISRTVRANLKNSDAKLAQMPADGPDLTITDDGYGETALLAALLHPHVHVTAFMKDAERQEIAMVSAENFVNNIEFKIQ